MRRARSFILLSILALLSAHTLSADAARQKIPRGYAGAPAENLRWAADAPSLSDFASLGGVAGYVEGRAREAIRTAISREGSAWLADAFADAINRRRRGEGGFSMADLFRQDAELKARVQADVKERLKEWLPKMAREVVENDLLNVAIGRENAEEARAIAERVARELDTSLNDELDAAAGGLYDAVLDRVRREIAERGLPGSVDITDLRGSIERAFEFGNAAELAAANLARLVGEGTVRGIRRRVEDALGGSLPPEAMRALRAGPEAFDRYISEARGYLPGQALQGLAGSVLNRPFVKLPTPAYAAMLAASAAGHYARAFRGMFVDPYELKRAVEVTRVMAWQIHNKQHISLTLMQLGALARDLAAGLGMDLPFDAAMAEIKKPLERIEATAGRIDAALMRPMSEVQAELHRLSRQMEEELRSLQGMLTAPILTELAKLREAMEGAGQWTQGLLSEGFDGVPRSWEDAKDSLGIPEELLGEAGRWRPMDDLAEPLGRVKRDLAELNERVGDLASQGGAELLEAAYLLGPAAEILDVERVPANDPSDSGPLDPVLLHNGEYVQEVTDLVIPGRGLDFRFTRIYRGRSDFKGELGWRWTHSYAERMLPWEEDGAPGFTHIDRRGRKLFYRRVGDQFVSPAGMASRLAEEPGGKLLLTELDGTTTHFDSAGRPVGRCDRYENCIEYEYDLSGLLSAVTDVYRREMRLERRDDGLLTSVRDFAGRTISFEYNEHDELMGVRSPAVEGYPKGKLTAYRCESPEGDAPRSHRISMVMDPAGRVFLRNRYDAIGRVIAQRYGDGPWMNVRYGEGAEGEGLRAWVTDRPGAAKLYEHDREGHLIRLWSWEGGAYALLASYRYEAGRMVRSCAPSGRCTGFEYGERGPPVAVVESAPGESLRVTRIGREPHYGRVREIGYSDGTAERIEYSAESPFDPVAAYRRWEERSDWILVARFGFDGRGQLLEEIDSRGVATLYEYYSSIDPDGDGVAVASHEGEAIVPDDGSGGGYLKAIVRDASAPHSGSRTGFRYDPIGNIIETIQPDSSSLRFLVNALNEVVRESGAGLWPVSYRFDANDNLAAVEIARPGSPIVHAFEHDVLDRLVSRELQLTEGRRVATKYRYDVAGRLAAVILPEGNGIEYEYDREGRLACIARGAGSQAESRECVERGVDGGVVAYVDGSGVRVLYERNGFGELMAERDGLGNSVEYERDPAGRVVGITHLNSAGDPLAEERIEYRGGAPVRMSRKLWRDDPEVFRWVSESLGYDADGRLLSRTDPTGLRTEYEYDGLGMLALSMRPDGVSDRIVRDAAGRTIESYTEMEGRRYGLVTVLRDGSGRVVERNRGTKLPWEFEYDGMGRPISAKSPQGIVTRIELDDLGRRVAVSEEGGSLSARTRLEWDGNGRLVAFIDANGNRTEYGYDEQDRLTLARFADGSVEESEYDGAGRVVRFVRRGGGTMDMEYDAAGRLVRRTAARGGAASTQRFGYDGMGRLLFASDENGAGEAWDDVEQAIVYDSLSRRIAERTNEEWITRGFDDDGRPVALGMPSGGSIYYAYGPGGLVNRILGPKGIVASIVRDPLGNLVRSEMGGNLSLDLVRDDWGREIERRYTKGGEQIARWRYGRDEAGYIVVESDSLAGRSLRYRRDGLGRLVGVSGDRSYEYDAVGNMVRARDGRGERRMSYNVLNELVSIREKGGEPTAMMHDGDGNLTHDGKSGYEYDPFGRLSAVITQGDIEHRRRYDAFGRMVLRGGECDMYQRFIWDGWNLASYSGYELDRYDVAYAEDLGAPLAYLYEGRPSYILEDGRGSARAVDGVEGFGQRCDFSPYGEADRSDDCWNRRHPFGFAGQLSDLLDGIVYMRYRHYGPGIGRFLSPDPLGYKIAHRFAGEGMTGPALSYHAGQGQASRATIPNRPLHGFDSYGVYPFDRWAARGGIDLGAGEANLYLYAGGDPISFGDPLGLASILFERAEERLVLFEGDGDFITSYDAANRTTKPRADPRVLGGNGPVPPGEFTVGVPEFYSVAYRDEFYRRFGLGEPKRGEGRVTGHGWAGAERPGYNISQGLIRFRVGAPIAGVDRIAWRREIFIHGGRDNRYTARTLGCIRARDDELETLAANFIALSRRGDPVDTLHVD